MVGGGVLYFSMRCFPSFFLALFTFFTMILIIMMIFIFSWKITHWFFQLTCITLSRCFVFNVVKTFFAYFITSINITIISFIYFTSFTYLLILIFIFLPLLLLILSYTFFFLFLWTLLTCFMYYTYIFNHWWRRKFIIWFK